MHETKHLLLEWEQNTLSREACVVCGDSVPPTILQRHHVNPANKSEGKVWLCASCHNIYNKAKMTTDTQNVIQDLKRRHERFDYNFTQSNQ